MTHQEVEKRAAQVLRNTETYRAPIPMEALLNRLNLTAEAAPLGQNVSGMLVAKDEGSVAIRKAGQREGGVMRVSYAANA
jgi:hypothetical protein